MVDFNTQMLWGIFSNAIIMIAVVLGTAVLGIFGYLLWRNRQRFKQYRCVILGKDGFGNKTISYDDAGIFIDKATNNKRFYLRKNNVGLSPDKVPFLWDGKKKLVFLQTFGLKNFAFLSMETTMDNNFKLTVTEEDVNWAINSYEKSKKIFAQSMLMQMLPYIALVVVAVVIMIIFIYFFRNFTVLKEVADAMKEAARVLAESKAGTIVS